MRKITLALLLLTLSTTCLGGDDIWENLFREKLGEAMAGNSNAQFDIGAMYQNGRGVVVSRDMAIEWYRKAAAQNNQNAISRLKLLQANEERFAKTLEFAQKGDAESQYDLGKRYAEGIGTEVDLAKAVYWYEKATGQGHVKAEFKLGLACYEGNGMKRNLPRAVELFKSAAQQGYPAAQYYVGRMYASGQGLQRNNQAALEWYGKALDGGFDEARGEINAITRLLKDEPSNNQASGIQTAMPGTIPAKKIPRKKIRHYGYEDLMLAGWKRDNKPVVYLPSAISKCEMESRTLVCFSDDLVRESAAGTIHYKTKAIISGLPGDGTFTITYRNLVIDAEQKAATGRAGGDEVIGGLSSGTAAMSYAVKTGWSREHTLECSFKSTGSIACLKDKAHSFLLQSPQALAAGN